MIPKIVHYCWFGGKTIPTEAQKNIDSCKHYNPSYEIKIWTEDNFDLSENAYVQEAYQSKKWAFITDYVRLKVLFEEGGIYMDTDVEVLKPLDSLLNNKAFSGFESNSTIPTGTMGAEANNPWIRKLLEYYNGRHFFKDDGKFDLTTNVETITRITKANYDIKLNNTFQDLGDVTFYPFDYLCAKNSETGRVMISNNTYTIHHFSGSWQPKKGKIIKWLRYHNLDIIVRLIVGVKQGIKCGK